MDASDNSFHAFDSLIWVLFLLTFASVCFYIFTNGSWLPWRAQVCLSHFSIAQGLLRQTIFGSEASLSTPLWGKAIWIGEWSHMDLGEFARPYCNLLWEPDGRYPGASYGSVTANGLFSKRKKQSHRLRNLSFLIVICPLKFLVKCSAKSRQKQGHWPWAPGSIWPQVCPGFLVLSSLQDPPTSTAPLRQVCEMKEWNFQGKWNNSRPEIESVKEAFSNRNISAYMRKHQEKI